MQRRAGQPGHPVQVPRLLPVGLRGLHILRADPPARLREQLRVLGALQRAGVELQDAAAQVGAVRGLPLEGAVRGDEEDLRPAARPGLIRIIIMQ